MVELDELSPNDIQISRRAKNDKKNKIVFFQIERRLAYLGIFYSLLYYLLKGRKLLLEK